MKLILEKVKCLKYPYSTKKVYQLVWHKFNSFLLRLDNHPKSWEERTALFGAFLFKEGLQSQMIKLYFSAIKATLIDNDYDWDDDKVILTSLVRASKLVNDRFLVRLPIYKGLLELLLFEIECMYETQPFLEALYKAFFLISYYGMFRVGELALGPHTLKAKDVHIAQNKDKILFVLYSSNIHHEGMRPQKIKITAVQTKNDNAFFCPFRASRNYLAVRGSYSADTDPFFIFTDHSPVNPQQVCRVLKNTLAAINLNPNLYNLHSLRIRRTSDMFRQGYSIEQTKIAGHWKSNSVYRYIRANIKNM